jgi:homoserine dehydrogenase
VSVKVAVLGCGSVGSQVVRLLQEQAGDMEARIGQPVELVGVAVRRLDAPREVEVPEGLLTTEIIRITNLFFLIRKGWIGSPH